MKKNPLGAHGVHVSALSLGSARLLHSPRLHKFQQRKELLRLALDLGINFFDTADSYASGVDEWFLGSVFRRQRQRVVIATKAGNRGSVLDKLRNRLIGGGGRQCFEAGYLRRSLEGSLRRLRTDHVDVFYLHSPPRALLAQPECYQLLGQLKAEGKARLVGVACMELADFFDLIHKHVDIVQLPLDRHHRRLGEARAICREHGIGLVLRQPFAGRATYEADATLPAAAGPVSAGPVSAGPVSAAAWLQHLATAYTPDSILFGTTSTVNLRKNVAALAQNH